jgi:hypothetical protein
MPGLDPGIQSDWTLGPSPRVTKEGRLELVSVPAAAVRKGRDG